MSKRISFCAVVIAVAIAFCISIIRSRVSAEDKHAISPNRLVVHEWGTMTSVMGEDGVAVSWRPLSDQSDLPGFVYGIGSPRRRLPTLPNSNTLNLNFNAKADLSGTVRLETPVVYFYANRNTTASLEVDFPRGNVTEWYPQGDRQGTSLGWKNFLISPGAALDLPVDKVNPGSRYYAARGTDAAPVRVMGTDGLQDEKFLFYRGVATFDLPLTVNMNDNLVTIHSRQNDAPTQAILFQNIGGSISYQVQDLVNNEIVFDRQAASKPGASLQSDLIKMLTAAGLYSKEAEAMVATWGDQWFEEGLRVFYVMPRKITDELLPLTVAPAPAEMARVLVCRAELITPEVESAVLRQVVRLGDGSAEVRDSALKALQKEGRFLEPILNRIKNKVDDDAIKSRIDELIAKLPVRSTGVAELNRLSQ